MSLFGSKKKGSDNNRAPDAQPAGDDQPLKFSDADIAKARKWFAQGKQLTEKRNYDYAIESYLNGLKFWPEAVEEGHIPLRVAAFSRRETGGKKPSTIDGMKHSMSGRDPLQGLLNAEWLWARDPQNPAFMEGMLRNAAKANLEDTVLFIAPIFFEAAKNEKKPSKDRFELLRKVYEQMGERCERRGDLAKAITFFEGGLTVLQVLQQVGGPSMKYSQELKDLATRVTIIKGKYDSSRDFRGSIKDSGGQKDIHDRERMILDSDRLTELIAEARADWEASPEVSAKLLKLVDLLCRGEEERSEAEAIKLLDDEYQRTKNYSYKSRAEDIRMKQLRREVRGAAAGGDREAIQQAKIAQLKFELAAYKERVAQYPTDNTLKFEYGRRLVTARRYDDAIPLLQEARNDPKNRIHCMSLIGRCFYEKGYFNQAIQTYNTAIQEHELGGDDLSKELYYWLGRSCEAGDRKEDAEKAYGQLIQWDYNYRDVRARLDALEE